MYQVVHTGSRKTQPSLISYFYLPLPHSLQRISLFLTIFLVSVPTFIGHSSHRKQLAGAGAGAGAFPDPRMRLEQRGGYLEGWSIFGKRADSRTDVCLRWSHQSVLVNDTIYIYGGQAKTSAGQASNTWSMLFLVFFGMGRLIIG